MLSQLVKSQGKGQGGTKSFVPLKTVPDKASKPAQRTHLENLWSVNVATTRYQPKLVKLVDEGSVILSLIYACTHTGVQTKCGYCTAYIQKRHFVWSFHLGQFSLPTSGWPLVLQFSLLTSGWPLVLQFSLPTPRPPVLTPYLWLAPRSPVLTPYLWLAPRPPVLTPYLCRLAPRPPVLTPYLWLAPRPPVLTPYLWLAPRPPVLTPYLWLAPRPPVLTPYIWLAPRPPVLTPYLWLAPRPPVLTPYLWLAPRCSHLLHPPHSSSCKTLLLWTSHSSCGRPNFLAFFGAYFVCCQNASSIGRSLLVQFSGGTYCDKSVQSIHTCHHYWPSGLLCAQRSMPDVLISCLHCRSLSCLDTQWIIAFVFPKDGARPLVQEIWAGLGVVCLWPMVK